MDQLRTWIDKPFARLVAESLSEDFFLIDVGAAGGVAPDLRQFGDRLSGFGFDPDAAEVERLNSSELAPRFKYVPGFVGLPADHPFAQRRADKPRFERHPWHRLAVERWVQILQARDAGQPLPPHFLPTSDLAIFGEISTTDYSSGIDLPKFLLEQGVQAIDFLKIDVDGPDYDILQSMAGWYQKFAVLGVGVEVTFFGSDADTGNTFHNVDRFLKHEGFELLDLTLRRYPMVDLPAPSILRDPNLGPSCSAFGRPYQGDAFYARDICAPWERASAEPLSGERLAKLAALFALFGLPDCAAEVLVKYRLRLATVLDVDRGLDLLAAQAQPGVANPLSYQDYLATFEAEWYAK